MLIAGEDLTLAEYIFIHKIKVKTIAEDLGYSRGSLSPIIHGRKKPTLRLAKALEKYTNGEVKLHTMLDPKTIKMLKKKI